MRNDGAADTAAPSGRNSSSTPPSARGATVTPENQKRPTELMTTGEKTTAQEGVADAKRQRTEQEAQNSSSSSVEPKAISEPAEVLSDKRQNIEDLLIGSFHNGEQQTRLCHMDGVEIDGTKDVPMEFVKVQVGNSLRTQHMEALRAQVERSSSDDGRVWPTAGS